MPFRLFKKLRSIYKPCVVVGALIVVDVGASVVVVVVVVVGASVVVVIVVVVVSVNKN